MCMIARLRPLLLGALVVTVVGCTTAAPPLSPTAPSPLAASEPASTTSASTAAPSTAATSAPTAATADPAATTTAIPAAASGVTLIGSLKLEPFSGEPHADIAAYKNLAFVGKQIRLCPELGVDIIDISDPTQPVKLANAPFSPNTATEDMQALRIGERDVLVIGLQACEVGGKQGLDLVDITDPRQPQRLSLFETDADVHELNVTVTPDGRTLALLAMPFSEMRSADPAGHGGTGDLLIVDISDPAQPERVSEWGVLDEPQLGPDFFANAQQGAFPLVLLHSVRADATGTRLYLSYWDAGVLILDITDPAQPVYLGRTKYGPSDEGNAHSVAANSTGTLLVQADEDFDPTKTVLTSNAFGETYTINQVRFARPIVALDNQTLAGEVVFVGRGCPAGASEGTAQADAYAADPRGKIALIERGACGFDQKIARAQAAGAVGVILYGRAIGRSETILSQGSDTVVLPDDQTVKIAVPAVVVKPEVGQALRDAPGSVTVEVTMAERGWGHLRLFDITNPARPIALSTFATPNTRAPNSREGAIYSVHNAEIDGNLMYAAWYNDGVRVIDIADPTAPREVAAWTDEGAPEDAPEPLIWSVIPHNGVLLASDMHYGLYILQYTP